MPRGPGKRKMMLAPPLGGIVSGASNYELQKGNLTHHQRLVIIRKKDEEPRWTQEDLARWAKKQFGLLRQPTQSTISNILRSREKLETMTTSLDAKSARPVKHPELDAALLLWLRDRQSQLLATNGDLVRDQARQLAELFRYVDEMTYSNGWMRGFLTRHDVAFRRNQVDPRETHSLHDIQMLAAGYPRQDVFTFVSTNLWYRAEPKKDAGNPPSSGTEPSLVVGLAVNMDGSEKWSPVFVSRAKQPPSFQQKTAFQWNFSEYYYNGLAQMTSTIFEVWIKRLNQRMAQSNRRVLLVVDSAPSHINAQLSHVHVVIHADTPQFHLHPLANHLSSAFKAFYRKRQLASAVDRAEAGARDRYAVSQLKAMRWAEQAWAEVPVELVTAAWASVGFVTPMPLQLIDAEHSLPAPPSPTAKKNEIHAFLTDLLEQLDVPGRIKSHDVVTPRGEDESPHYVYNDTTIMPLVEGALQNVAEAGWEHDIVDVSELALPLDATAATSQQHRTLLVKLEQLRGVIQSIDEESAPNDEVTTVLAFLRRRQATLRADLQRLARETEQHPHPTTTTGAIDHSQQQVPVSNAAPAMQDTSMGLIV